MGNNVGFRGRKWARERKRIVKGRNGGEVENRKRKIVVKRRGKKRTFVMTIEKCKNELKQLEF
jgi:hypothetical protein